MSRTPVRKRDYDVARTGRASNVNATFRDIPSCYSPLSDSYHPLGEMVPQIFGVGMSFVMAVFLRAFTISRLLDPECNCCGVLKRSRGRRGGQRDRVRSGWRASASPALVLVPSAAASKLKK
jgi:hypothetical protein